LNFAMDVNTFQLDEMVGCCSVLGAFEAITRTRVPTNVHSPFARKSQFFLTDSMFHQIENFESPV
jgi:hypothetical protein